MSTAPDRTISTTVESTESSRLDQFLREVFLALEEDHFVELFGEDYLLSRSRVEKLIRAGHVAVNSKVITKAGFDLRGGERVEVNLPEPELTHLVPDPTISLDIIFEDQDLLVLNKQPGLTVHPGAGVCDGTLANALLAHLGDSIRLIGDKLRPGIVHRLDKDTSGIMVVAKNQKSFQHLSAQFLPPRTISRIYHGVTFHLPGNGVTKKGTIDVSLGRDPYDRTRVSPRSHAARDAVTHWEVLRSSGDAHLLQLSLETGRTHQIRAHLQHVKSPLLGDPQYGAPPGQLPPGLRQSAEKITRQALHAQKLSFVHPRTGEVVSFEAEYPSDFTQLIADLF